MRAIIENDKITIENPTDAARDRITALLSYKDKSKEFLIRKMKRNRYYHSSAIEQIKSEIDQSLLEWDNNGCMQFASGLYHILPSDIPIIDNRSYNGKSISLPWNKKPYDLRPYQQDAVNALLSNYRGIINLATGLGKTLIAVHTIKRVAKKTLVICPNISIANNFYNQLCIAFGDRRVGFFGGGKKKIRDITVGVITSVNNHVQLFQEEDLGLIILDECHHTPCNTLFNVTNSLGKCGRIFGLTATNFRNDGKDLLITAGVGRTLLQRDVVWGIKNGWLATPCIAIRRIATKGPDIKFDKLKNYKHHVLKSREMTDTIINDCKSAIAAGKSVLCLVKEVAHGKEIAAAVNAPFATASDKQSNKYVEQLNNGEIPCLIGTDSKIGEGTDTKRVDVVILANFVANKGSLLQNLGRGLRIHDPNNKKVIIIDYIPMGSSLMQRHAALRIKLYKSITQYVKIYD